MVLERVGVIAALLALMVLVAWWADRTLPPGQLPWGRTEVPNTSRWFVLGFLPAMFAVLLLVAPWFPSKDSRPHDVTDDFWVTVWMVPVGLFLQQVQLWGVRRIMRKQPK